MRHLPPPTDENAQPMDAGEVFETCIARVRDTTLRARLRLVRAGVEAKSADYDTKAASMELYQIQPQDSLGGVSCDELVKVYEGRMVPKKSRGRPTYDRIRLLPVHGVCPFCGIGAVGTLDHYLPKGLFPVYSVTPNNLIAACMRCQGEKLEYYAKAEGQQLLHPYFDDFDDEIWLSAEVVNDNPAGFRYFSSPPDQWTPSAKTRVATHLTELNLQELFSENAGSRLAEIRHRLAKLYQLGGADAVRAHLREELASIEADHKNSWVSAMYRAAVASDWFCDGGFLPT